MKMSKSLEDKIDKILEDMVELKVDMAETKVTLHRNTDSLELHIKRTNILEEKLEKDFEKLQGEIDPIKSHVSFVKGALWLLGALGAIVLGLEQLGLI